MIVTNKNLIQEEIKRRLNCGSACYHSIQNLVFSSAVKKLKNDNATLLSQFYGEFLQNIVSNFPSDFT
jgi:hypothetical protein